MPNGIIIVYKIRYRESYSSDSFVYVNTTNTQPIIDGLLPITSYTIGVRAYTIAGPGEWIDIQASTLLPGISGVYRNIINILLHYRNRISNS